jgi:hypothetical protein
VRWKERTNKLNLPALQAAAVPSAVAASPYDKFALEALPQSAYATYFTFNNKVCPKCGYRRPLYCWDCFEPVVLMKVGADKKANTSKKGKNKNNKNQNRNGKAKKARRIRPAERLVVLKEALDAKHAQEEKAKTKKAEEVEHKVEEPASAAADGDEGEIISDDDDDEGDVIGADEIGEPVVPVVESEPRKEEEGDGADEDAERREARKRELQAQAKRAEILVKWNREEFEPHSLVLPLKVDIIIQPKLKLRRCTSIVAAVLSSPRYVEVHRALASHSKPFRLTYSPAAYAAGMTETSQPRPSFSSRMPTLDPESTVVLYPSPDALSVEEVRRVIFP